MNWEPRLFDNVRGDCGDGVVVQHVSHHRYRVFWRRLRSETEVPLSALQPDPVGMSVSRAEFNAMRAQRDQARGELERATAALSEMRTIEALPQVDSIPAHKLDNIRAYVKGLRAWNRRHDNATAQYATDILYLIGEE